MTIKYTGDGAYFVGIPARDLTDDEFAALPPETQTILLDSGVYAREQAADASVEAVPTMRRKRAAEPEAVGPAAGG